jgi:ribosome-associated toxin RatA of RatAB toxin-antitoxin module
MSDKIHVEASHVINVRPDEVYAVISDYRVGHPAILPKPEFTELTVIKGGQGAGTELRVALEMYGQKFSYHQIVTEPEPGRTLVETDIETGQFSRFTFEPLNGGKQTKVTIFSEFPASNGIKGFMERLMQPSIVSRLYKKELRNLEQYMANRSN